MCRASRRRARSSTTFAPPGEKNATDYASFLGAGAYRHYRPVIIDSLVQRGEFLTSYTPYQAEITQGTLQAIFEFQTMIAELTGMDVANASMYDGSTGAAEAVMMAVRVTGRHKAVVAATVHPEYREVLATYAKHQGLPSTSWATIAKPDASILCAGRRSHRRNRSRSGAEPQLLRRH
jgi:glycine cleavage system pyridoxal-binding protein P